jgi:hypothetical protein
MDRFRDRSTSTVRVGDSARGHDRQRHRCTNLLQRRTLALDVPAGLGALDDQRIGVGCGRGTRLLDRRHLN